MQKVTNGKYNKDKNDEASQTLYAQTQNRTNNFLSGVTASYFTQSAILVAGFFLTPFLLRKVGSGQYGWWLLANQFLGYLSLLDLGVLEMLPREVAYLTGKSIKRELSKNSPEFIELVQNVFALTLFQSILMSVIAVIAWYFLPSTWSEVKNPLLLSLSIYILLFPFRIFESVLQGLQDIRFICSMRALAWLLGSLLTFFMVIYRPIIYSLIIGWGINQLFFTTVSARRFFKWFPDLKILRHSLPKLSFSRPYLRRSIWLSLGQISQIFLNGTDLTIVGSLSGPAAVSAYASTGKLLETLSNKPLVLMQSAVPGLSEIRYRDFGRLATVMSSLTQLMLLCSGAVACLVLAINETFVIWWVGPKLFGGVSLTVFLVINMIIRHWATTQVYTVFCLGREREMTVVGVLDGLVTLILSILFCRHWGVIGVPIGSILSVCIISGPALLLVVQSEFSTSLRQIIISYIPWLSRLAIVAPLSHIVGRYSRDFGIYGLVLATISVVVLYTAIMLPLVKDGVLREYIIPRLEKFSIKKFLEGRA